MTQALDHLAKQMMQGEMSDADCRSRGALARIAGKWSVLVLIALRGGTLRLAALRRRVNGVGERMLATSLRQLAARRLVERRTLPVLPPRVEYTPTPLGHEAADHLVQLTDRIETNVTRPDGQG